MSTICDLDDNLFKSVTIKFQMGIAERQVQLALVLKLAVNQLYNKLLGTFQKSRVQAQFGIGAHVRPRLAYIQT